MIAPPENEEKQRHGDDDAIEFEERFELPDDDISDSDIEWETDVTEATESFDAPPLETFFPGAARGERREELLHLLRYGPPLLIVHGEPGVGKRSLVAHTLARVDADLFRIATLEGNEQVQVSDLFGALVDAWDIEPDICRDNYHQMIAAAAKAADAQSQTLVLLIYEAQALDNETSLVLALMLAATSGLPVRVVLIVGGGDLRRLPGIQGLIEHIPNHYLMPIRAFNFKQTREYLDFLIRHSDLESLSLSEEQSREIFNVSGGNAEQVNQALKMKLEGEPNRTVMETQERRVKGSIMGWQHRSALSSALDRFSRARDSGHSNAAKASTETSSADEPGVTDDPGFVEPAPASQSAGNATAGQASAPFVLTWRHKGALVAASIALVALFFIIDSGQEAPQTREVSIAIAPVALETEASTELMAMGQPATSNLSRAEAPALATAGAPGLAATANAGGSRVGAVSSDRMASDPALADQRDVVSLEGSIRRQQGSATTAAAPTVAPAEPVRAPQPETSAEERNARDPAEPEIAVTPSEMPPAAAAPSTAGVSNVSVSPGIETQPEPALVQPAQPAIDVAAAEPAAAWYVTADRARYTMQLLSGRERSSVEKFLDQYPQVQNLAYYETRRNGTPWYVVIQGNYASYDAAKAAVAGLPAALQKQKPWIRKLESVQKEIAK